jgi:hypothetical protein
MWLLPTLNRTEKLRRFLKSAKDTNTTEPGRLLIDKNDFHKNEEEYIKINNLHLPNDKWAIEITDGVTMGQKCREYIPKLKADTEYVALLNDDHLCISENWDQKLISRLDGKNFVSANDRRLEAWRLPVTATAWSMPLLRALGWPIYPPFLEHLFIDNLWFHLGKITGCWRMVASAVVEHDHVLWGRAQEDDTHKIVYGEKFSQGQRGEMWIKDEQNFRAFINSPDFGVAIQRIRELQDFLPGQQWNPKVSYKNENSFGAWGI